MKGHMSSPDWGGSLCRQEFPNAPTFTEPAILSVGSVRDEGMSAPKPILEIDLCKYADIECDGGHGEWQ